MRPRCRHVYGDGCVQQQVDAERGTVDAVGPSVGSDAKFWHPVPPKSALALLRCYVYQICPWQCVKSSTVHK